MGTRINGFIDYRHTDHFDRSPDTVLRVLETTTPACQAVEEYWRENDASYEPDRTLAWGVCAKGKSDRLKDHWWFSGPGCMSIRFYENVAEISAGGRWRGFLSIPPLRHVHRVAFVTIAQAIGASGIIFVPDYAEELIDAAIAGSSFEECLKLLEEKWGPMQGDLDEIRSTVIAECEMCPPKIWFLQPT